MIIGPKNNRFCPAASLLLAIMLYPFGALHANNASTFSAETGQHPYSQIRSHFGDGAAELPDCSHRCTLDPEFTGLESCHEFEAYKQLFPPNHPDYQDLWWLAEVEHISVDYDQTLGEYVFFFHSHYGEDGDCNTELNDRLRTEIKAFHPSPSHMKGEYGDEVQYTWDFRLDDDFRAGNRFTHIFQVKAADGEYSSPPLITLTPRGSASSMQILHGKSDAHGDGIYSVVHSEPLNKFLGEWLEAEFNADFQHNGSASLTIRRKVDGQVLLEWDSGESNLEMWRQDASFNRGKWGIYRSNQHSSSYNLKDETVRFNNICISKSPGSCTEDGNGEEPPSPPACPYYDPAIGQWVMCP